MRKQERRSCLSRERRQGARRCGGARRSSCSAEEEGAVEEVEVTAPS